jgi:hypothetical protein
VRVLVVVGSVTYHVEPRWAVVGGAFPMTYATKAAAEAVCHNMNAVMGYTDDALVTPELGWGTESCAICAKRFEKHVYNQKRCGDPECDRKAARMRQRTRREKEEL